MVHYRMMDRLPSVMITRDQNELKIYNDNIVYLNNGENFELKFFNPTKFKIGAEIIFNGTKRGQGLLVINPGQSINLDRFLDEKNKMLFDTYYVDGNNKEVSDAIAENGNITINFYKEKINDSYYNNIYTNTVTTSSNPYTPTTTDNITYKNYIDNFNLTSTNINLINNSNFTYTSAIDLETGRIEKGGISKQELKNVDVSFEYFSFHTINYKIMPTSSKNVYSKEIRQYCPSCKYRIRKQTWKYCPSCGGEL